MQKAEWKESVLTPAMLRERLDYNPETGELTWRDKEADFGGFSGKPAGSRYSGYLVLQFSNPKVTVLGHRAIWAIVTGAWPTDRVDHRDRNGLNNRWSNLREATQGQNMLNRAAKGAVPFKGVCFRKARGFYVARITAEGRLIYLGSFKDPVAAARAYDSAAVRYHGEFSSTNVQLGLLEPEYASVQ